MAAQTRITRDDLEAKFRELAGDVDETAATVKSYAIAVGAVIVVSVAAFAFIAGRRRGRAKTTVVEIKRI